MTDTPKEVILAKRNEFVLSGDRQTGSFMSNVSLCLKNFLQHVPICQQTSNLETVLAIFQSGNYQSIAIVNEQQFPLGIIKCRLVMLYLLRAARVKVTEPPDLTSTALELGPLTDIKTLMEPIEILSAQMSFREFFFYLQSSNYGAGSDRTFAIVDSERKFLGLLDSWNILKFSASPHAFQTPVQMTRRVVSSQTPSLPLSPYITLQSLDLFLERVPLPLMLQTADGQICKSNSSWYERLGNFSLPQPENPSNEGLAQQESFEREINNRYWWFVRVALKLNFSQLEQFDRQLPVWMTIATDITEQHRLSQKLAAKNADLVELNHLKAELLSSFSHELKSPATAIVGLSRLLQEQQLGKLNQRQVRYAKQIYDSGRQLMLLANNILDLMRLEAGQLQLQFKLVKLETLCQRAYDEARSPISEVATKFTLTIDPSLDTIVGDELRLQQMLVHLLTNAFQSTSTAGEIGLKVSLWDNWIAFSVWDTGVGIPAEIQPLIFQKLLPSDSEIFNQEANNGLGLLLTQQLARNHGGDISFTSAVNRGSQFTLLIPTNPNSCQNQRKSNRLVLIVESVERHITNLTEQLLELGYYFAIARTGTEALIKADRLQPTIILLNPSLPLLSGWEVLTLLKSDPNTKNIPTIVTAESNQKQQSLSNEANGFLSLPVQLEFLKETLDRIHQEQLVKRGSLTILNLCDRAKKQSLAQVEKKQNFVLALSKYATNRNHRILEADSLEQADIIARVWKLDVVLLDGKELPEPLPYLRSLCQYDSLASLPLVTLNSKITKAANKIGNLAVFPCLVPTNEQNLDKLFQVIEIATSLNPSIE